jgi:hypothetical protein
LVIAFLLWSAASFVNGVALRVDGGEFARRKAQSMVNVPEDPR